MLKIVMGRVIKNTMVYSAGIGWHFRPSVEVVILPVGKTQITKVYKDLDNFHWDKVKPTKTQTITKYFKSKLKPLYNYLKRRRQARCEHFVIVNDIRRDKKKELSFIRCRRCLKKFKGYYGVDIIVGIKGRYIRSDETDLHSLRDDKKKYRRAYTDKLCNKLTVH